MVRLQLDYSTPLPTRPLLSLPVNYRGLHMQTLKTSSTVFFVGSFQDASVHPIYETHHQASCIVHTRLPLKHGGARWQLAPCSMHIPIQTKEPCDDSPAVAECIIGQRVNKTWTVLRYNRFLSSALAGASLLTAPPGSEMCRLFVIHFAHGPGTSHQLLALTQRRHLHRDCFLWNCE